MREKNLDSWWLINGYASLTEEEQVKELGR